MGGDLYALDFDGLLCDSCRESSLSAVKGAKVRWPWVFEQVDAAMEEWIVEQMCTLRPVVETGYENLLLVRLLVEIQIPSARKSSGRFAEALLKELAGIEFPSKRIYAWPWHWSKGKSSPVTAANAAASRLDTSDRLATLKNVIKEPAMDQWNLYLVNWEGGGRRHIKDPGH